ncbi:beta-amyrin synthase 1-like [Pyrus communis]|uniref:beta-amyrin synthase 1-like n=1 Tax=Pyrus communis TaxID=23211 RepID=UPI0035C16971
MRYAFYEINFNNPTVKLVYICFKIAYSKNRKKQTFRDQVTGQNISTVINKKSRFNGYFNSDQDHGWQVSDSTADGLKSKNGGLAAWEPAGAAEWLELLNPTEFFADIVVEHEYVECTSSAIQALVLFKKLYPGHRKKEIDQFITNAAQYLENTQMADGSWYGNWGVCFTYGTWFALGGLTAAGKTFNNCAVIRKAIRFFTHNPERERWLGRELPFMSKKGVCSS